MEATMLPDDRREDRYMASIRKEILIETGAETVWAAVRDVGALHERLVPDFVVDTRLEEGAQVVTLGNGMVAHELIVDLDDESRRLAWSARGGRLTHHNASAQVFTDGERRSLLVWVADLLPQELPGDIRAMIEPAAAVMKTTLEGRTPEVEACRIRS
jgi:Polyketide cyclase / dehydrase and lipid transport